MKLAILAGAAALSLLATAATAQQASVFGNTIVMTGPDGSATRIHFKQDGTYDFVTASGVAGGGVWAVENGQLCTTRTAPAATPKQCRPDVERHIGDKWDEDTPSGKVSYELVAGQ
ncbi:MAG: hypothetical protein K1X35_01040 [Caulobacteraceae bacterium]|nr:hypothetical protein [Caulobacteraceae bacterium]